MTIMIVVKASVSININAKNNQIIEILNMIIHSQKVKCIKVNNFIVQYSFLWSPYDNATVNPYK